MGQEERHVRFFEADVLSVFAVLASLDHRLFARVGPLLVVHEMDPRARRAIWRLVDAGDAVLGSQHVFGKPGYPRCEVSRRFVRKTDEAGALERRQPVPVVERLAFQVCAQLGIDALQILQLVEAGPDHPECVLVVTQPQMETMLLNPVSELGISAACGLAAQPPTHLKDGHVTRSGIPGRRTSGGGEVPGRRHRGAAPSDNRNLSLCAPRHVVTFLAALSRTRKELLAAHRAQKGSANGVTRHGRRPRRFLLSETSGA